MIQSTTIQSMTGFSHKEEQAQWGGLVWELRTVNHRYLEATFRLPEIFRELEPALREIMRHYLQRGKFEATLRFFPAVSGEQEVVVNLSLAKALIRAGAELSTLFPHVEGLRMRDLLYWPQMVLVQEVKTEGIKQAVTTLFKEALEDLVRMREREGKALAILITQRLETMQIELGKVKAIFPQIVEAEQNKIKQRFSELQLELDPRRLEEEVVLLLQKITVDEEIERLDTHIHEVLRTLKQGDAVGRRLDFLMQELNREANTLASKSIHTVTSKAAIELKVLIEQMREQIQNIE